MLNTKGLVILTEYQQMGWRLIKVENCEYLSETYIAEFNLFFNEIYSFTSNFDFEKPLTGSIKTRQ